MHVIYALPFFLLSVITCLSCLAIPKTRQYAIQAAVAPLAFGFFSIIATGAVLLLSDYSGVFHFSILDERLVGWKGFAIALAIYFVPGFLGAWLSVSIVSRLKARFSK